MVTAAAKSQGERHHSAGGRVSLGRPPILSLDRADHERAPRSTAW